MKDLIDDPRFTQGEQHAGCVDPFEGEFGPREDEDDAPVVYHRRGRLSPLRGNRFYRDKHASSTETICGAMITEDDVGFNHGMPEWSRRDDTPMVPCEECLPWVPEPRPRKCPTCGDTGSVTACDGGEEPCPDCPTCQPVEEK